MYVKPECCDNTSDPRRFILCRSKVSLWLGKFLKNVLPLALRFYISRYSSYQEPKLKDMDALPMCYHLFTLSNNVMWSSVDPCTAQKHTTYFTLLLME